MCFKLINHLIGVPGARSLCRRKNTVQLLANDEDSEGIYSTTDRSYQDKSKYIPG